jgi:hypothetical protein
VRERETLNWFEDDVPSPAFPSLDGTPVSVCGYVRVVVSSILQCMYYREYILSRTHSIENTFCRGHIL